MRHLVTYYRVYAGGRAVLGHLVTDDPLSVLESPDDTDSARPSTVLTGFASWSPGLPEPEPKEVDADPKGYAGAGKK